MIEFVLFRGAESIEEFTSFLTGEKEFETKPSRTVPKKY
jgi:hypothetical protein